MRKLWTWVDTFAVAVGCGSGTTVGIASQSVGVPWVGANLAAAVVGIAATLMWYTIAE